MTLAEHREAFEVDGSLRDLYVLHTTIADWQMLLDHLKAAPYRISYTLDGNVAELPAQVGDIFAARHLSAPLLSILLEGMQLNCHFFTAEQIEFDLDPRQVTTEARYEALLRFIVDLGHVLGRRLILTEENAPEAVWFDLPIGALAPTYMRGSKAGSAPSDHRMPRTSAAG